MWDTSIFEGSVGHHILFYKCKLGFSERSPASLWPPEFSSEPPLIVYIYSQSLWIYLEGNWLADITRTKNSQKAQQASARENRWRVPFVVSSNGSIQPVWVHTSLEKRMHFYRIPSTFRKVTMELWSHCHGYNLSVCLCDKANPYAPPPPPPTLSYADREAPTTLQQSFTFHGFCYRPELHTRNLMLF